MLEILRKFPVLRLEGNKTVTLKNVRRPAKMLSLSAEAKWSPTERRSRWRFEFGPENGVAIWDRTARVGMPGVGRR
jgi:adenine-specific DNA-methyltransferase